MVRDLTAITTGDTVFFYETGRKAIHGVFEVTSEPFVCADGLYSEFSDPYPFRFAFKQKLNFPNPMPDFEFIHLVDRKVVWSTSTLQHDPTSPFRSIVNLSESEAAALERVLVKYNTQSDPTDVSAAPTPSLTKAIEALDVIGSEAAWPSTPTVLGISRLPTSVVASSYVCRYEFALQAYFAHMLSRRTTQARSLFGVYRDSLTEVPLSAAEPRRIDVLCTYSASAWQDPFFFQIVELKRQGIITAAELNQLVQYMRIFSQKKGVEVGDVSGTYVGKAFNPEAVTYVQQRARIEVEKPIALLRYSLSSDGEIDFEPVA
ncbi:MAG: hypothetical protein HY534_03065 [Chloroflexi bacterium]|nr:hypothetical protein [Chloroflexota bacterium]